MSKFIIKNHSKLRDFFVSFLVDFGIDGADYLLMLFNITENQFYDTTFWQALIKGLVFVGIKTIVKMGLKKFFPSNENFFTRFK